MNVNISGAGTVYYERNEEMKGSQMIFGVWKLHILS